MAELTDLKDLNKNAPARSNNTTVTTEEREPVAEHVEHEALKGAKRGMKRQHDDEPGVFSNIGSV